VIWLNIKKRKKRRKERTGREKEKQGGVSTASVLEQVTYDEGVQHC
jgi:hypothetical protein